MINITKTVEEVFAREDFENFAEKYYSVSIKPNICSMYKPPATTSLDLVEKVVSCLLELGKEVVIIESDQVTSSAETRAKYFGFDQLGVPFVNVRSSSIKMINIGSRQLPVYSPKGAIINLAVPKPNDLPNIETSCAVKNLFGLVGSKNKGKLHAVLPEVLSNLLELYSDRVYTIVDCRIVMEGKGSPTKGRPVRLGEFYVSGINPTEIDRFIESEVMGFKKTVKGQISISEEDMDFFQSLKNACPKIGHLKPTKLTLGKRLYYWLWENLDNPIFRPLLRWRQRTWEKLAK